MAYETAKILPPPAYASWRFPISSTVVSGLAAAVDSCVVIGVGSLLYFSLIFFSFDTLDIYVASICFVWIFSLLIFQFCGLYEFEAIIKPSLYIDKIAFALLTAFLFLLAAAFAFKVSATLSRVWMGSFGAATFASVFLVRFALSRLVLRLSRRGVFTRNVVVVGTAEHVTSLVRRLQELRPDFVTVTGIFIDGARQPSIAGIPVLGALDDVASYVRRTQVDDVVVALPWSAERWVLSVVERLRELPVNVYLGSELLGYRLDFRQPPSHFANVPVFSIIGRPLSGWGAAIKTIEDYLLASIALFAVLPLMALIALAVKLDSPGPVLFKQKRLGFNNREFMIYKFRSMQSVPAQDGRTVQATRDDCRVTRVGRFLRRSSLDELPQLFNVLNGTMSLVGPRPHAVDHNHEYSQKIHSYFARHRVKPGITGWAQVNGCRGETDTADKMEARVNHDIFYAENWSLFFDLRIMVRTVLVCLGGHNAY